MCWIVNNWRMHFVENKAKAQTWVFIVALIIEANELLSLNPEVIVITMDISKFLHNGIFPLVSRRQHISFEAPSVIYFLGISCGYQKKWMAAWMI